MMLQAAPTCTKQAFQLKGSLFTLTVLQLQTGDLSLIRKQCDELIIQAPKFFMHAPMVIDLQQLPAEETISLKGVRDELRQHGLIPVGVRGGTPTRHQQAQKLGLAILAISKHDDHDEIGTTLPETQVDSNTMAGSKVRDNAISDGKTTRNTMAGSKAHDNVISDGETTRNTVAGSKAHDNVISDGKTTRNTMAGSKPLGNAVAENTISSQAGAKQRVAVKTSKIVTKPVRSGQQVYARGGDLIILAPVSEGAELLADGSIHIYGPLRGRALAGINGNESARIFCFNMQAELLSIASRYVVSESLLQHADKGPMQVFLEKGRLQIQPLS